MSGHSKWSQIKRSKGAQDAKRSQQFGRLTHLIAVAARHGADPEQNSQLRLAIDRARAANMPKENIERTIEKASGSDASNIHELLLEAYGPEGVAFLIEGATDNKNRTVGEVRAVLNRHGGKLAEGGSVKYLFDHTGLLSYETTEVDSLELAAIDAGATDISASDENVVITTLPNELSKVKKYLEEKGFSAKEMSLEWVAKSFVLISEEQANKVIVLLELLEDLDDIEAVHTNFEIFS